MQKFIFIFSDLHCLPDFLYHSVLDGGVTQNVVWGNACLTAVGEFTPSNAAVDPGTRDRQCNMVLLYAH